MESLHFHTALKVREECERVLWGVTLTNTAVLFICAGVVEWIGAVELALWGRA
jgi:hypothetical protein